MQDDDDDDNDGHVLRGDCGAAGNVAFLDGLGGVGKRVDDGTMGEWELLKRGHGGLEDAWMYGCQLFRNWITPPSLAHPIPSHDHDHATASTIGV